MKFTQKINIKNYLTIALSLSVLLLTSISWFSEIPNQGLVIDEIPYTLNSQFYFARKQGNMTIFSLHNRFKKYPFSSQEFQLLDQPQLQKYIIGAILDVSNQNPWKNNEPNWLYKEFTRSNLPSENPYHIRNYLGEQMTNSIITLRYASAIVGFLTILIFTLIMYRITNSKLVALFTLTYFTIHPLIRVNLRIATTNSYSLFFLVLSSLLMIFILNNLNKVSLLKLTIQSLFLGTLIAWATSIKLNGAFLLAFPFFLILIQFFKKDNNQNKLSRLFDLNKLLYLMNSIIIGFFPTFFYLEPESWRHPILGIQMLFSARITQQEWFFKTFGKSSFIEVFQELIHLYLSVTNKVFYKAILALILVLGTIELKKKSYKKSDLKLILYFSVFVLLVNSYYARVKDFNRYLIPSILILVLLSSMGLKKIITNKFLKKLTNSINLSKDVK